MLQVKVSIHKNKIQKYTDAKMAIMRVKWAELNTVAHRRKGVLTVYLVSKAFDLYV